MELLIPVLQERGIMWKDYAVPGGTLRENMLRKPGQKLVPKEHPGARFRYDELLKTNGQPDGSILIDRVNVDLDGLSLN